MVVRLSNRLFSYGQRQNDGKYKRVIAELLISWTRFYGISYLKIKKIKVGEVKAKQNQVLCK